MGEATENILVDGAAFVYCQAAILERGELSKRVARIDFELFGCLLIDAVRELEVVV